MSEQKLSDTMRLVLKAVARGEVRRDELSPRRRSWVVRGEACTTTVEALAKRGLIERGQRLPNERYSLWSPTDDGRTVLARMDLGRQQ